MIVGDVSEALHGSGTVLVQCSKTDLGGQRQANM